MSADLKPFEEEYVKQCAGGQFHLPEGEFKADDLADLFRSWAAECDTWTSSDGRPITVIAGVHTDPIGQKALLVGFNELVGDPIPARTP